MDYKPAIITAALAAGIEPSVALAVARQESDIQQYWQSTPPVWALKLGQRQGSLKVSGKGAVGIMQVLPSTAPHADLRDPQQNIQAGVGYLAELYRKFSDWGLAIAAYNWGEGRVRDALKGVRAAPVEVADYVTKVLGPNQFSLSTTGKLANVVGPQAAHQVQETAHKVAREHPGLIAVALFVGALVLVRRLR